MLGYNSQNPQPANCWLGIMGNTFHHTGWNQCLNPIIWRISRFQPIPNQWIWHPKLDSKLPICPMKMWFQVQRTFLLGHLEKMVYLKLRCPLPQEIGKNSIFMAVLGFLLTIRYLRGRVWKTDLLCQAASFPTSWAPDLLKISGWLSCKISSLRKDWLQSGLERPWLFSRPPKMMGLCPSCVALSKMSWEMFCEYCFWRIMEELYKFNHPSIWKEN